jgi:hypothetical protein
MKLYSNPGAPRPQAFYLDVPTPASAYARQQHLLDAYNEVLYTWWEPEALYLACFGDLVARPLKNGQPPTARAVAKRLQAAEDRLGYEVPELLERMTPEELEVAAGLFCKLPLPGFVAHVLSQERTVQHRLSEGNCRTRLDDDRHAIAAGLGKSRPMRQPGKVDLTMEPTTSCFFPVPTRQPIGTPALIPHPTQTPEQLRLRVNRAQERRRLKRKRR